MNLTDTLNPASIIHNELTADQYLHDIFPKTQIILHHSAGWDNAKGMIAGWQADKPRVATSAAIVDDGSIYQAFPPEFWAAHVGFILDGNNAAKVKFPQYWNNLINTNIEHRTIGVEVCNWGYLIKKADGKYHTYASSDKHPITLPEDKVIHYENGFRGFNYYERYTDHEIEAMWKLIRYWSSKFNIPCKTIGNIFDLNEDAVKGTPGVYCHTSFRADKCDLHPQNEVIQMLKAL